MILLIALFDDIFMNIIVPWVGLVSRGPMVTVGFFQPIYGVGGVRLSNWGQTHIQLRCRSMLIALAWVAGGGLLLWAGSGWPAICEQIIISQISR